MIDIKEPNDLRALLATMKSANAKRVNMNIWDSDIKTVENAIAVIEAIRTLPLQDHAGDWQPISAAPKDGSTVLFRIELAARAYWDDEMKDWVLNYPINMECVRNATGCALSTRPMVAEEQTEAKS